MLNPNKEADQLKTDELKLGACPICSAYLSHIYFMQDGKTKVQSKWYSCSCGILFQDKKPTKVYDKKYLNEFDPHDNKLRPSYEYSVKIYAPIIEELIYGRKVLILGKTTDHQQQAFEERGWVTYSIDKNMGREADDRNFVADFENFQFPEGLKFNLIWCYQTLECFDDPVSALSKCKELLSEDGILFLASPDADFVHTRGTSGFIHWRPELNHIMWNRRSIAKHLESLGFNLILNRQNYERRFTCWDDFHCLAQRRFF